jgi:NitT/TauT family transport system substrate-binding protein
LKARQPDLIVLADTRSPEGLRQWVGSGSLAGFGLVARPEWLLPNPDTAHRLARAVTKSMRWMREHAPAEIRQHMPEQHRLQDVAADLEAIRDAVVMLTPNGRFEHEGIEASRNLLAVSAGESKLAPIDLSKTYTNDFVKENQ